MPGTRREPPKEVAAVSADNFGNSRDSIDFKWPALFIMSA